MVIQAKDNFLHPLRPNQLKHLHHHPLRPNQTNPYKQSTFTNKCLLNVVDLDCPNEGMSMYKTAIRLNASESKDIQRPNEGMSLYTTAIHLKASESKDKQMRYKQLKYCLLHTRMIPDSLLNQRIYFYNIKIIHHKECRIV